MDIQELSKPCLYGEGRARGFTRASAKAYNFCSGCRGLSVCQGEPASILKWYSGHVRIKFKWKRFDVLAYTAIQAKRMVRDEIGFDKSLSDEDFEIKYIRDLTITETLTQGSCKCRVVS